MKTYRPTDEVDFVVVGSGAAGGVMARELARAGFSVVVLEQGPWLTEKDFSHEDTAYIPLEKRVSYGPPTTARANETEKAEPGRHVSYGRLVGGGTVHFTANYWRQPEIEFQQATRLGVPEGSNVADWPISYRDLEPYYTKVEWEIGVSGKAGNPFEPWRSRPYPLPPLPIKSEGVLCERGAANLGWHAWPAPMAILSRPYRGRSACVACGLCPGYGCEVGAKSSTLVAMIPGAVATKRCEIRPNSYVRRVETGANGRVTGVTYFDLDKQEVFQRAKAVVLAANGVETPRLLLLSASSTFPDGLANSSGQVGRNLMNNPGAGSAALFEREINAWKGVYVSRVVWDFLEAPKGLGLYGGGGIDIRRGSGGRSAGTWPGEPTWGSEWKKRARVYASHSVATNSHQSMLPVATNRVDLDPEVKDSWGLPVSRITSTMHPLDLKLRQFFADRGRDLLEAAGPMKILPPRVLGPTGPAGGEHLLGTCRMGKDPKSSVINADHRAHDVPNLFMVDGSSMVSSGRGQPTMTIQALAFRAADRIAHLVRTRSI